ncbi:MAG TPA: hypothetical protein VGC76_19520 [Pyrinomonadaceae bacterium]|jgi:hypothetical protein
MKKLFGIKLLAAALILTTLSTTLMAQSRIRFARGATSTTLSGTLAAGGSRGYVIRLSEGQTFTVNVSGGNDEISIKVSDVHGAFNEEYGYFETETDANGDHYITIRNNGRRSTRYTMTVSAY